MTSSRGIRPIMDPHYHYDHPSPYEQNGEWNYYNNDNNNNYDNSVHQANASYYPQMDSMDPEYRAAMSRRFSSPQMGYYDLITGEYRYRSEANQSSQSPLQTNYAGETEPPMCENTCCKCCQVKVPFDCLTICLITSLMLLLMFSLFKMLLGAKPKNPVNMNLFGDMVWLLASLTLLFISLTVLKYTCFKHSSSLCAPCARCKLMSSFSAGAANSGDDRFKRELFCHGQQFADTGEEFV